MENYKVFSIYDVKSASYGSPITSRTRGTFLREIQDQMSNPNSVLAKHPMDFSLYEIGKFDPQNGAFVPHENKDCFGSIQDLLISSGSTRQ